MVWLASPSLEDARPFAPSARASWSSSRSAASARPPCSVSVVASTPPPLRALPPALMLQRLLRSHVRTVHKTLLLDTCRSLHSYTRFVTVQLSSIAERPALSSSENLVRKTLCRCVFHVWCQHPMSAPSATILTRSTHPLDGAMHSTSPLPSARAGCSCCW